MTKKLSKIEVKKILYFICINFFLFLCTFINLFSLAFLKNIYASYWILLFIAILFLILWLISNIIMSIILYSVEKYHVVFFNKENSNIKMNKKILYFMLNSLFGWMFLVFFINKIKEHGNRFEVSI